MSAEEHVERVKLVLDAGREVLADLQVYNSTLATYGVPDVHPDAEQITLGLPLPSDPYAPILSLKTAHN